MVLKSASIVLWIILWLGYFCNLGILNLKLESTPDFIKLKIYIFKMWYFYNLFGKSQLLWNASKKKTEEKKK